MDWVDPANIVTLRDKPLQIYIAASGAGAGLISELWEIPGISSILVGYNFPYATRAMDDFLGFKPDKYCSKATSIDLALQAYIKAYSFETRKKQTVGLGITATVSSLHPHKGKHRFFIAVATDKGVFSYEQELPKENASRFLEGMLIDDCAMDILLQVAALSKTVNLEDVTEQARKQFLCNINYSGLKTYRSTKNRVLFPGSFNPPHEGHYQMVDAVYEDHGDSVFMISTDPPHKPALTLPEILQRASMLKGEDVIFLEGAPLYLDKARRYPNSKFLIGMDTVIRILDPKWGPEVTPMLQEFSDLGTRFLVSSRLTAGQELGYSALKVPKKYKHLFINSVTGRYDISSSQLRAT